jgi:hypothetical protein
MPTRNPVPEPTPEQIELIMYRLLAAARSVAADTDERALIRIGKRAGYLWTHRGCTSKGFNPITSLRCIHCGAARPASKEQPS